MLMTADRSSLLIVDVQEKLCPVMDDPRIVLHNGSRLMRGAARLGVPVTVTEQYPEGIGPTMFDLRELTAPENVLTKRTFSSAADAGIVERLRGFGRPQVVVAGIESHVCVLQTCLGFRALGYEVFVVRDACSSRRVADRDAAFVRMAAAGVAVVTTEMVLFEWLGDSRHEAFREVSKTLIK
ncbi:hydrolase [Caenispirillum bisanense]|uniref:Nicotinamidase-related amidase n=1 Tax=Caenispirillum bisanense TaxID=414052 RepID=A0A286G7F9_9PROT|nr:hydrolase [Caenispirillum bisanense]SOD91069.1 Nicotinamidase-related amidase [Caenispirillum bisanense]